MQKFFLFFVGRFLITTTSRQPLLQNSHTLATVYVLAWWGEIFSVEENVFMGGT